MDAPTSSGAPAPEQRQSLPHRPIQLTARMLNEFVYCPRLFYYEFVEGVFLHNADTLAGKAQHTKADAGKGKLAAPAKNDAPPLEEPATIHSRSVMLGSESLHVTAKMDLVEAETSTAGITSVMPVEYKKGSPRQEDDGITIWDADKIQLGIQIIVLRENGYPCSEGILFYRETRQRVRFILDTETEAWIRQQVLSARQCAAGDIPAPLDHSPKCPRCSLVSICLPDETLMLQQSNPLAEETELSQLTLDIEDDVPAQPFSEKIVSFYDHLPIKDYPRHLDDSQSVRRLITPDTDTKAFYVHSPKAWVGKKGETLVVKEDRVVTAEVRIKDIHHLAVFGPSQLSTAVIHTLCERDVPISYFSMNGWFYGVTRGHQLKNVFTRIQQFATAAAEDASLPLARQMIYGKIRNQRTLLMRNHIDPPRDVIRLLKYAALNALNATSHANLLGIEGAAASAYFRSFAGMIKVSKSPSTLHAPSQLDFPFSFTQRNRRPPTDAVNALLSLAYSLLTRDCTQAATAVGFDPYVGFYHQPRFGRPSLALDVMEEFRPLVADSVVLTLINNRMLQESDFIKAGNAVNLSPSGRKTFFLAYEKRLRTSVTHPVFNYKVSYRRAIELQFRLLAKVLIGEIPNYIPLITR